MSDRNAFAQMIRQRRQQMGLTQGALGDRVGLSGQAIWEIESGRSRPRLRNLSKLSSALGLTISDLQRAGGYSVPEDTSNGSEEQNAIRDLIEVHWHLFDTGRKQRALLELMQAVIALAE